MAGRITGLGYYAPAKIVSNDDLAKTLDTSDEWISSRTGIRQRHIAAEGESVADMAVVASRRALAQAGLQPNDIDCVILATISNGREFPSEANYLTALLGMTNKAPAFDVKAACTGFVYALHQARAFLDAKMHKRILLVGSEKMSDLVDWTDRNTAVLFGDGAGAMVLEASDDDSTGIIDTKIYSDGSKADLLYSTPSAIHMDGKEVYKNAVTDMPSAGKAILDDMGLTEADIDWLLPHQANLRIIQSAADKVGFPMDKVIVNVDQFANTSGASGIIALAHAAEQGQVKKGQKVLYTAFGAGLTWGAALIKM
ncbi:MAG: ketoacyl-ACP synthase III [Rickettsiales bacterium]|jgi:3-oxoacyl-[acyl-carrier-protein] synthase-3|nr:ketoacyl-ACP synthase III [Rickettsiales bacterium]